MGTAAGDRWATLCALALLFGPAACAGALSEGEDQFRRGRYPEAKQTFAWLEPDASRWGDPKRAEYALYRGLTLAALGDRAPSVLWLREAKAIEVAHPGALSVEDLHTLDAALQAAEAP
jgi:hypothetical protein